jgi:type III pantothenate kinase
MRSGIFWGYVGLIEGIIERIRGEIGSPMGVIATGGVAPLFTECCPVLDRVDPDLTLKGLYAVFRRNISH